jgi:ankyrin repeat domain-containing protein 50
MLQKSLTTLPSTLDETYDRILCAINDDDSQYAIRILRWLAFSKRPLQVEEVAEVVAIDPERDPAFDRDEVLEDPLDVLAICPSLVTIATNDGHIRESSGSTGKVVLLAHYSVKEYLTSGRCRQDRVIRYNMQDIPCNEFIAKSCLGYLLQFQRSDSLNQYIQESKLARYSAEFWTTHVQGLPYKAEALNRLIMKLFLTGNGAYLNSIRIYNPDRLLRPSYAEGELVNIPTPLYYASLLGLNEIVSLLILKTGADVNAQGGGYGNALQAASVEGQDKIVTLLLDKGADVDAQGGRHGNALHAASARGHDKIVALLLDNGADVNAEGGHYSNALEAASAGGYDKIIALLLDKGADVNVQGGHYGSALQAASVEGHDKVVALLLRKGADQVT